MSRDAVLNKFEPTGNLVLVRVLDAKGDLRAVLPNLAPHQDALRVFHGSADRDNKIGKAEAQKALDALAAMNNDGGPVRALLESAPQDGPYSLWVVASPVEDLLSKMSVRGGTLAECEAFVELLDKGEVRAAEKVAGLWQPQPYVIDGILNFFKVRENSQLEPGYWDKIPLKTAGWSEAHFQASGVRFAPGCKVRVGAHIGPGTVIMNQAFVNIGAYIAGQGVMIDGASRVASAAQIGKNVKFGAGSGIEGILEPAGRLPSIVEDHVKVGAMCEISGIVGEGSVIASGVIMASGKKIFDEATGELVPPLEITVGDKIFQVPVIPPYRLVVGGSLLAKGGRHATDAIILKPGDLREKDTLKHFEKQGILYS
ncbi:MAG: hypothetical protein OEV94_03890 [Deltaproteobacteria bacterium]|nr:hypothetical protein [Deltaproteobacteria bacterium]